MIRLYALLAVIVVCASSCEKAISFTPDNAEPTVVVEATIEDGQPPVVILSRSLNYFTHITPELLVSSFIHDADIEISNGSLTHRLKEYTLQTPDGYALSYYTIDSSSLGTAFVGEQGKAYSLRILTNGEEYTATTTIPLLTKTIDSLWWQQANNHSDTNKVMLMGRFIDPPGFGNYIRFFTSTNDEPFYPGLNSVFDDQIIDGKTYSVQIERGVNRNEDIDFEEYSFFERGDSVTVKFTNIDKATFDFWRTMEYSYSSIGNPFATPVKVLSNISGGALGYFGGYAVQYISLVIPE
jgi:hypothetical protein